jgi:hypothetical protein
MVNGKWYLSEFELKTEEKPVLNRYYAVKPETETPTPIPIILY